jgi:uncharacterized protein (DUF952 family)
MHPEPDATIQPMDAIYHLAPAGRWRAWSPGTAYLPAEYERDGFIHLTRGQALMLRVANRFYRAATGDFVLLEVDPSRLRAPLRWEAGSHGEAELFPHLYGPLDYDAVVAVHAVRRDADGAFVGFGAT